MANRHTPHTHLPPSLVAPAALARRSRRGPAARVGATTRTSAIRFALPVALALASLAGAPAPAHSAFPGDNGLIAFTSYRASSSEIWTMSSDGSAQTRLTNSAANDYVPAWSPDGSRIAFTSDRDRRDGEIYLMAGDGSSQTRPTNNDANGVDPAWSPDGTRLAFVSYRDRNAEIYTMARDGSAQTRLTNSAANDYAPAWSPDGSRIAFMSDRDGNVEIYTMAVDGWAPTRVTNNAARDANPEWSPDGTRIAFDSGRDGNVEIYTMAVDGWAPTRVTNNAADDVRPAWSPDGRQIAFASYRDGNSEIYTMASDGSSQTRITNDPWNDEQPDWQPVARRLVPPPTAALSPSGGATPPPPRRGGPVERPLTLSKLALTRRAFCVGRRCPRSRRGTLLRFALSAAARVQFALERRASGRRAGGGCRRPTRQNRRGRRCSYYTTAGSFSRPATAGVNRVAFTGKIAGRTLRPGSYRLSLIAIGAGGARSKPQRIHLTTTRS